MKLIIGGAYQGKLEYATEKYKLTRVVDGDICFLEDTVNCQAINNFNGLIKRFLPDIESVSEYLDLMLKFNPKIILIMTEMGSGVVPTKKADREFRELIGRASCEAAKRSDTVEHICCGLATTLK